ncbi:hypothetical protein EKO27_g8295 [Xylaria grammica]|uniref:Uncharacterized protein n=1 Tax=Xylaria grammica TaxID=363999 RepID=A0A439CXF9_9PEZI|nr:hypothetical protein EKO27_g8295 [Xylaria grammica]
MSQSITSLGSVNRLQATKRIANEIFSTQLSGKAVKFTNCEVDTIATDGDDDVSVSMTYHDNKVRLPFTAGTYKLDSASFTVTDLSITPGQDPDIKNRVRDVKLWNGERGSIQWSVGRSKSTKVAQFWKENIKAGESTFGHNPDELNFAFMGRMDLTISGGVFTVPTTFTIEKAAIGQGSSGATNNWWFGCSRGTNVGGYRVRCSAMSESGQPLWFYFLRGGVGNDVDEIRLDEVESPGPFVTMFLQPNYVGESIMNKWQNPQRSPPYVTYYTSKQADTLKLHVKDGLLYDVNNELFDTSESNFGHLNVPSAIFVLSTDARSIYASRQHKLYMFHHSSMLAGGDVFSAGEISVEEGVIKWMSNASGHYKPDAATAYKQFKIALWNQGYRTPFPLKPLNQAMLDLLDRH